LEAYDGRIRNWFATTRKFSGKTASTRQQIVSKKGAPGAPFLKFSLMPQSRQILAKQLALRELE
jgi:hypothetical protein